MGRLLIHRRPIVHVGVVGLALIVAVLGLAACSSPKKPPPATTTTTTLPVDPLARMLDLVNAARAAGGRVPLTSCENLREAAARHSQDMADNQFLGHEGSDGSTAVERAMDAGYDSTSVVENIAQNPGSADDVFDAWMDSAGHQANILDPDSRHVGHAVDRGYWTQVFGFGGTC